MGLTILMATELVIALTLRVEELEAMLNPLRFSPKKIHLGVL